MGLGKTIQTISFLSYLFHQHQLYGPFLIVSVHKLPVGCREKILSSRKIGQLLIWVIKINITNEGQVNTMCLPM